MFREPSRRAVLAVRAVKAAVTMAVAGTALVLTLGGATASPADAERFGADARCAGVAGKTIVRTHEGAARAVSFEHGWEVYRGERPGTLLVVCPE
jgi:hypothetical protein